MLKVKQRKDDYIDKLRIANYKAYPLNAPGMPMPGVAFITQAQLLGDKETIVEGKKTADKRLSVVGEWLDYLYKRALYEPGFFLPIEYKHRTYNARFIPGQIWGSEEYGPKPAKVMVVGKIYGRDEAQQNKAFCGESGQFLIEKLNELNITDWRNWYVTPLVKFPNPTGTDGGQLPTAWVKDCLPLLHQELRLVRPDYILSLGSEASKFLLGKTCNVTSTVGEIFDIKIPLHTSPTEEPIIHVAKMMTCTHPAAVLSSSDWTQHFESALNYFGLLIKGHELNRKETDLNHIVVDNAEDLSKLINQIMEDKSNRNIAIDAEWHGERPTDRGAYIRTIQFSWKPKNACCVVLRRKGGVDAFKPNIQAAVDLLKKLLLPSDNWNPRIIGHFLRADLPWLLHLGIDLRDAYDGPPNTKDKLGWERTYEEGGFDTSLAAHAWSEAGTYYKLEILSNQLLGIPRWDSAVQEWKKTYCKENDLKADQLDGYGDMDENILIPYSIYDADSTRRLFDYFNKPGGALDCDRFMNNCREAFWMSQRASPAILEMESKGIKVDKERTLKIIDLYNNAFVKLRDELRKEINWPDFNMDSPFHCRELLFGVGYSGGIDKDTGEIRVVSPEGAALQNLTPITSTGKRPKMWADIVERGEEDRYTASTGKETLGALSETNDIAAKLRDLRFIKQVCKTTLKLPEENDNGEVEYDEDGEPIFEKGLLSYLCDDGRVRTRIKQTLETGRYSSSSPNLQAVSKRRESDYKRILKDLYPGPVRAVFCSEPGKLLIEADFSGAELFITALMSRDEKMLDHCIRSGLSKNHPDYYDIHSRIAVAAFQLKCEPTKDGLKSIGKESLRIAAKNVVFGVLYGRGAVAISRQCREEHVDVSPEQAQEIINAFFKMYPRVPAFMDACKKRVTTHGWICNPFGRFRRFNYTPNRKALSDNERSAMNFDAQSAVADSMSLTLSNLYHYRDNFSKDELDYDILLSIHDAVLLEVEYKHVDRVLEEVLPDCMTKMVEVWPVDLNGIPYKDAKPINLAIATEVCKYWGESITAEVAAKFGIPEKYIGH